MSLEQSQFLEQFSYQEPILPDSVDNATAFFRAFHQLIRSTPSEICETPRSGKPLYARVGVCIRGIVISVLGWVRRFGLTAQRTKDESEHSVEPLPDLPSSRRVKPVGLGNKPPREQSAWRS
jgi:hypothetical protein